MRALVGGHRDRALIEYRVTPDQIFKSISYEGVPDIRIIVLMGYPVMAMLRLPTRQSGGKANLHQGAIGVGVDLATGLTLRGTWLNNIITKHPDTTNAVDGVQLLLLTERPAMETVLDFVVQGNTAQVGDQAFVDELKSWIRYSAASAVRRGDGLYAASSGNPTLPDWLLGSWAPATVTAIQSSRQWRTRMRASAGMLSKVHAAFWSASARVKRVSLVVALAGGIKVGRAGTPAVAVASRMLMSTPLPLWLALFAE